jgi:hypothetical protein
MLVRGKRYDLPGKHKNKRNCSGSVFHPSGERKWGRKITCKNPEVKKTDITIT